jgi:hypothetical protein
LFRTIGEAVAGAGAAFARTEITSFGKLLLQKSSGGVDTTSGDWEDVADRVGTQAWVVVCFGATGLGFAGSSNVGATIFALSVNISVPCGM